MKKWITLILTLAMLLSLSACDNPPVETTGDEPVTPPVVFAPSGAYPLEDHITETPTGVLFFNPMTLYYYNKLTDENDIFCFDPICTHNGYPNCIAYKFFVMSSTLHQTIEYCDYNRRFYALRGEQLYSFAFDGSDLRLDASFGENGKFENDDNNSRGTYDASGLGYMKIQGQYVYFLGKGNETGRLIMYRFDAETGKYEQLLSELTASIYGYHVNDHGLYVSLVGENAGFFRANPDGTGLVRVRDYLESNCFEDIFDGEQMYFIKSEVKDNVRAKSIVAYNPDTDTYQTLYEATGNNVYKIIAVTDAYVYFTSQTRSDRSVGSRGGKSILRLDRESGEVQAVFEKDGYDADGVFFLGDQALVLATYQSVQQYFICDIDENGNFINLTSFRD